MTCIFIIIIVFTFMVIDIMSMDNMLCVSTESGEIVTLSLS